MSCWRTRVGIGVVAVDLGDRDDDRDFGRARVADRLDRLRHDTVVGGDHEDRDVGRLRAAATHGGERLVTRRVDERDEAIAFVGVPEHAVGTDALRDATGFTGDDVGVANRVEERGLSVVDVTEHRDDRRARLEQRVVFVVVVAEHREELDLLLAPRLDEQHLRAERLRDQLDHLVGERHRRGDHLAGFEQDADEVGGRAVQLGRELLHRDTARDDDLAFGDRRVGRREPLRRGLELGTVATTLLATPLGRTTRTTATGRDRRSRHPDHRRDHHRTHRHHHRDDRRHRDDRCSEHHHCHRDRRDHPDRRRNRHRRDGRRNRHHCAAGRSDRRTAADHCAKDHRPGRAAEAADAGRAAEESDDRSATRDARAAPRHRPARRRTRPRLRAAPAARATACR